MGSSKERPLMMLKDYLKLDQSFDTRTGCEATVRRLIDMELRHGTGGQGNKPTGLTRSRSKVVALTRISTLLNSVRMLATAASASPRNPKQGILQRSLSKRLLLKAFWRRRCTPREEDLHGNYRNTGDVAEGRFLIKDVMRLDSFVDVARGGKAVVSPSPCRCGGSCSSCSCSSASRWSEIESSSGSGSGSGSDALPESPSRATEDAKTDEIKERGTANGATCHDYEEKEQLSPVSVMDFPYDDLETASEEAAASPPFQQSIAGIERTKHELLKKIRRFEGLARLVHPVELDESFDEEEEDPEVETVIGQEEEELEDEVWARARRLLEQVNELSATKRSNDEILLLDFFVEGLLERDPITSEEHLLLAARDWTDGVAGKDVASREALATEMDVDGGWRCINVMDDGMASELEQDLLLTMVDELLLEMSLD